MGTKQYKKKDIDIRIIFAGIAFFCMFLFYPLINILIHDNNYLKKRHSIL